MTSDRIDTAKERESIKRLFHNNEVNEGATVLINAGKFYNLSLKLLDALDAKDVEISRLEVKCDRMEKWIDSLRLAVDAKDAEIEGLRSALEQFATEENWFLEGPFDVNSVNFSGESFARATLKGSDQ